jgi:hypothetical protein
MVVMLRRTIITACRIKAHWSSVTTAKVTDTMARWLLNETDAEDFIIG